MGDTETRLFETGMRGWFKRWAGVGTIMSTVILAAVGGAMHMSKIEDSISRLSNDLHQADRRITTLEASSVRDREAIVRIEVSVMHITEMLKRIENKIESKHP